MQSVKIVVRQVGNPSPTLGVVSGDEVSQDVEKYTSQGYVVQNTMYLGEVKDHQGSVQGWKVMFVLTKDEEVKSAKAK